MKPPSDFLSREIAAGNDPDKLFSSVLLIVGGGATGSNAVQTTALTGVGEIRVVDFDRRIERSNLTRSPLYGPRDVGEPKARVLAERARAIATAPRPRFRYAARRIEELGFGAFEGVSAVLALVDSLETRARLADLTRAMGVPLVEAGFGGSVIHVTAWSNRSGDAPCFRCFMPLANPERAPCSLYAREAVAAGFIPATQTAAAVAGNLAAEAAIGAIHGNFPADGVYLEIDVKNATARRFRITRRASCHGVHRVLPAPTETGLPPSASARRLFASLAGIARPVIELPGPLLITAPCGRCGARVDVEEPLDRVTTPCCRPCRARTDADVTVVRTTDGVRPSDALAELSLARLGYAARDVVVVSDEQTSAVTTLRLAGSHDDIFRTVTKRSVAT